MNEPVNMTMLILLVVLGAAYVGIAYSPDAMEGVARRLRARARAMRSAREHWKIAYRQSIHDDLTIESQRLDFNHLVGPQ